jgi:hypothetical protein
MTNCALLHETRAQHCGGAATLGSNHKVHNMTKRRFVDAPADQRCSCTIFLRDGSEAQCGRRKKVGGLCTQHTRMAAGYPAFAEADPPGVGAAQRFLSPTHEARRWLRKVLVEAQ